MRQVQKFDYKHHATDNDSTNLAIKFYDAEEQNSFPRGRLKVKVQAITVCEVHDFALVSHMLDIV